MVAYANQLRVLWWSTHAVGENGGARVCRLGMVLWSCAEALKSWLEFLD